MKSNLRTLRDQITWVFAQFNGEFALYYRDLSSNLELSITESETFPAGSTIKLAILIELLRQIQQGQIQLDERVSVDPKTVVKGSGILRHLILPINLTMHDLATLMIINSDNIATNLIIQRIGLFSVNRFLDELDLTSLRLNRVMMDFDARRAGRDNYCSAQSLGALLTALWTGRLLSTELTGFAMEMLKQTADKSRIRYLLPSSIEVAHKPGSGDDFANDAGIIFSGDRPYALVILCRNARHKRECDQALALVSGFTYCYHTGEHLPLLELLCPKGSFKSTNQYSGIHDCLRRPRFFEDD